MLVRLADERATGALLRDHGTLYLSEGRVVHAESPTAPGIDTLLTTGGGCRATAGSARSTRPERAARSGVSSSTAAE